jgi:hypothetical protein
MRAAKHDVMRFAFQSEMSLQRETLEKFSRCGNALDFCE